LDSLQKKAIPASADEQILQTESRYLLGRVVPQQTVTLSFGVTGELVTDTKELGAYLESGEVVAKLNDAEASARLSLAESELSAALSNEKLEYLNYDRISDSGDNEARVKLDTAKAKYERAVASTAAHRSRVKLSQIMRDRHILQAPIAGYIAERMPDIGTRLKAEQLVTTLVSKHLRIRIGLTPSEFFDLSKGIAIIRLEGSDSDSGLALLSQSPVANFDNGLVEVEVEVPKGSNLVPGGFVSLEYSRID